MQLHKSNFSIKGFKLSGIEHGIYNKWKIAFSTFKKFFNFPNMFRGITLANVRSKNNFNCFLLICYLQFDFTGLDPCLWIKCLKILKY